MEFVIGWPQGLYLALVITALIVSSVEHGKPRNPGNVWHAITGTIITLGLLYWGGFFG